MSIWKGTGWYDTSEDFALPHVWLWEAVEKGDTVRAAELFAKEPQLKQVVDCGHESPAGLSAEMLGSPLAATCWLGHRGIASVLLEHGAKVDKRTPSGDTPLILAARGGHVEIVRLLLDRGADPDGRLRDPKAPDADDGDWSSFWDAEGGPSKLGPLHWAAQRGDEAMVCLLIERGATCDLSDHEGNTALHHAAHCHSPGVAWHLLRAGADIDVENDVGLNPYCVAHGGVNSLGDWVKGTWNDDLLSGVLFSEIGRTFDYETLTSGHQTNFLCTDCQMTDMYAVVIQGENKLVCHNEACREVIPLPLELWDDPP